MSLFRRGPSRQEVEVALDDARGLIEILKLSRANLDASDAALREAESFLESDDTGRAKASVEAAERIATALEADYRVAAETVEKLRGHVDRMKSLGMPVEEEERGLAAVHERALSNRDLEGQSVPDYAAARALAEDAWARAEARRALYDQVSDGIFAAELAVDGGSDSFSQGSVDALVEAMRLLDKARTELAAGNFELAATDASVAEKIALGVVEQRRRAQETLESVERLLTGLKSLGIPVGPISKSLEMGRTLLAKGKLVAAVEVFNEAAQEAVQLGTTYRQLLDAMTDAAKAVDGLRGEGFPIADADSALSRAKAAMKAGNYALAHACAEDVHLAVRRQRETRDGLKTWLEETKSQIATLRDLGLAFVNDVEEMVEKAERAFDRGDYSATSEDLRIAALLMKPALSGRVRDGPELAR